MLRSGGPTTLNSCVFLSSSFIYQQAKRLSPLLILRFRAGALRHPAGEFPLPHNHIYICTIYIQYLKHLIMMFYWLNGFT
jgi:hypothetical protein